MERIESLATDSKVANRLPSRFVSEAMQQANRATVQRMHGRCISAPESEREYARSIRVLPWKRGTRRDTYRQSGIRRVAPGAMGRSHHPGACVLADGVAAVIDVLNQFFALLAEQEGAT